MLKKSLYLVPLLLLFSGYAGAQVSQDQADRLLQPNGDLTPLGAEKAGNDDGSIPAWTGGLTEAPDCWQGPGTLYCDPFPGDEPRFTITAANMGEYEDLLTEGHKQLFRQFSDSYSMRVYETRRTTANPDWVYEATHRNATQASLGSGGEALVNAVAGIPFPIPESGKEVIWNHKVRYRGQSGSRYNVQLAVTPGGNFTPVVIREDINFWYSQPGIAPADLNNIIIYFLQIVEEPPRLAGTITLVHETMDQVAEPRRAWQYNPGQRRLRRAPNVAYDNPGTAADGLRTNDQLDMFNGALDRYTWKLVGKREMIVPFNAYKLRSDEYRYRDIVRPGHIDQDLPRYERRRVWVVDAEVQPGTSHIYDRRVFYVDEDSWAIVAVDIYDRRGNLWRFHEGHFAQAYDQKAQIITAEISYDFQNGRYLLFGINNQHPEIDFTKNFRPDYFSPANVSRQATR